MCIVVLTGPNFATSVIIGNTLSLFKPQQMAAKNTSLALALISLMLHFNWNWIGLAISDNDQGTQFLTQLRGEMEKITVCFAFTLNPLKYTDEFLARLEWMNLNCKASASRCKTLKNCLSNASLQWLKAQTFDMAFSDESYEIYNAVYAVAHAFHAMLLQHVYNQLMDNGKGHYAHCLKMPPSVCSADCGPGFRKFWQEGMAACCFDCSPCPQNEVSNETKDVDNCVRCPEDQYANREQNQCIQKAVVFLNYKDTLGMVLTLMALFFSAFTTVVLGIFVKHHDTPIVKANNQNLSYILLISLIFCFLCPLLFIGHPNTATCVLQHITFGVVFTLAVSTVLAKTVTVLLAFKVTAPRTRMRYFLVSGLPNYIIAICTLIQIILSTIWLQFSPPFIDKDVHSEHGQIIIVCNKGSVTAFYCVLGYHGSLALASFIVAFLARNLPDTFNEAKLLTFSMLLFCSVWVTFIPVYHSTKGKIMVVVEVLSILASSAGLLGCIFIPKCYIILLRPERNSLQKLREKTSS
ncbi:hypothetical protein ACRRTK_001083 [Alexandromys fortis]